MSNVGEAIINFAAYENGTEFMGMTEATLPKVTAMTQEVQGAGIAGKTEVPIIGMFDAMSTTLNFRTLGVASYKLLEPRDHHIELRAAQQVKDTVSGKVNVQSIKHVLVLRPKDMDPGKVTPGAAADASGEYPVSYWATYIDGKKVLEIDVYNYIYFVNGIDYCEKVRKALGK